MRIIVTRVDAKRYSTIVERGDGVKLTVPGYGFMRPLPHDLGHYVVEATLNLLHGFWGSVAGGANLPGMVLIKGREKPHAAERARATVKANAASLSEAERLVACFETLVSSGRDRDWRLAEVCLKEVLGSFGDPPPTISRSNVAAVCAAWRAMQLRWGALPIGECLSVEWKPPHRKRNAHHRR